MIVTLRAAATTPTEQAFLQEKGGCCHHWLSPSDSETVYRCVQKSRGCVLPPKVVNSSECYCIGSVTTAARYVSETGSLFYDGWYAIDWNVGSLVKFLYDGKIWGGWVWLSPWKLPLQHPLDRPLRWETGYCHHRLSPRDYETVYKCV